MEGRMSALNRRVRDGLPPSSAEDAAWRQWRGLPPRQEKRRKRKKRKEEKASEGLFFQRSSHSGIWALFSTSPSFLAVPVLCLGVAWVSLVRLWILVRTSAGGFWTNSDYSTRGWTSDPGKIHVSRPCSASRWRLRSCAMLGATADTCPVSVGLWKWTLFLRSLCIQQSPVG